MKIIRLLRFVVALPICGCLTNYYEQYYIGYASIGYSSFTGPYTPMSLVSDLASVGADRLVHELLDGVECPGNGVGQCSLRGDFT